MANLHCTLQTQYYVFVMLLIHTWNPASNATEKATLEDGASVRTKRQPGGVNTKLQLQ